MRKERGFTLIELAIVLVIIGIIIGMVLKGQDLIQNARMKRLVNDTRKWEVGMWTCFDRTGKFPGDTDGDGIIADDDETLTDPLNSTSTDSAIKCFVNLANAPSGHTIQLGSDTFYIYTGNTGGTPPKNVIVLCEASNCGTALGTTALEYARAFDSSLDGTVDVLGGVVRAATTVTVDTTYNVVTGVILDTTGTSPKDWGTSHTAIVYFFDRKP